MAHPLHAASSVSPTHSPTHSLTHSPTPHSDLHAPRPPARDVLPSTAIARPGGGTDSTPTYRCRSGQHAWRDPRDARRCCNGFWRAPIVDALRGRFLRWERDPGASHDACYTPRQVDALDPADADTRTACQAVVQP